MSVNVKVSVVMPVFNAEKFLEEAIESILTQTFADFEFVIVDDGSTDRSLSIIQSYSDSRIKLIINPSNLGLVRTLNLAFSQCQGKYICRFDSDDVSLEDRLFKQYQFMESNPGVTISGGAIRIIDEHGHISKNVISPPCSDMDIAFTLMFESAFVHPSTILRRSDVSLYKYSDKFVHAEDYELWVRIAASSQLANLKDELILYRQHSNSISAIHSDEQCAMTRLIRKQAIFNFCKKNSIVIEGDNLIGPFLTFNEFNNCFVKSYLQLFDLKPSLGIDYKVISYYCWREHARNARFGLKVFRSLLQSKRGFSFYQLLVVLGLCILKRSR